MVRRREQHITSTTATTNYSTHGSYMLHAHLHSVSKGPQRCAGVAGLPVDRSDSIIDILVELVSDML